MERSAKIYVAGHKGMVGSAICRNLESKGYKNLIFRNLDELNLLSQSETEAFFRDEKPDYVFLAAAKVGGIVANNTYRAQFIYENLQIQNNIIHFSWKYEVKKLLFLGSSCIYPKLAPQPIREDYLLTGELEYTNEPYAIAKIAGMKMCEAYNMQYHTDFISVMPTNLYGPNDNYNLETSHVLPALIRKMHLAHCLETEDWTMLKKDLNTRPVKGINGNSEKKDILGVLKEFGIQNDVVDGKNEVRVTLWGTGTPLREFLYVEELADACVFLMEQKSSFKPDEKILNTHINIGSGKDNTINELANIVKKITGFKGQIFWDKNKPDGTPRKLLDVSKLNQMGFGAKIGLEEGIKMTYKVYSQSLDSIKYTDS